MKKYVYWSALIFILFNNTLALAEYAEVTAKTVLDETNVLLWQQTDDGTVRNYYEALQYCEDLVVDNIDTWRLPSSTELNTLIDLMYIPTINPIFSAQSGGYLTADLRSGSCMGSSGYTGVGISIGYSYSYLINFADGTVDNLPTTDVCGMQAIAGYVRCVSTYKAPVKSMQPVINLLLDRD